MSITSIPAGPALPDPQRTTAVWSLRLDIDELLETFHSELDAWMTGSDETAIIDAREKLIGMRQRIDAMQLLGPPSQPALHQLLQESIDA